MLRTSLSNLALLGMPLQYRVAAFGFGCLFILLSWELIQLRNQTREALQESRLFNNHASMLYHTHALNLGISTNPKADERSHTPGNLASEASYGFLEYSNSQWEKMVAVHRAQSLRQHGSTSTDGKTYFQFNWEPTLSCAFEQRIGSMGDGGKWVCDAYKIAEADECNVVSIGSNNDWSFEEAVHKLNPRCKIFTFDHTVQGIGCPSYVTFHQIGIGHRDFGPFLTIESALRKVGLENKMIDLFKIDCEGCEKTVFQGLLKPFLRQILIEVHYADWGVDAFFEAMTRAGYVIFHKEPNTFGCQGRCIEYGFLKMHPDFSAKTIG